MQLEQYTQSSDQDISCTTSWKTNQQEGERITIMIIIIILLFILGSIYSTCAILAEQMIESNITGLRIPTSRRQTSCSYLQVWSKIWTRDYHEQIQLGQGGTWTRSGLPNYKSSALTAPPYCLLTTDKE